MADLKTVINGLGKILVYCHNQYNKCDGAGQQELASINQTAKDAIELLKAQGKANKQLHGGYIENLISTAYRFNLPNVSLPTSVALEMVRQLKTQEPRLMLFEEVIERGKGAVLWVEEAQGVTWNLFPLEIDLISTHPDTDTYYLFFITYHGCKKFEATDYGTVWRCWTERPTREQRKAVKWG